MAEPKKNKKSVETAAPVAAKTTFKMICQARHLRNVEKKKISGSVFARARTKAFNPLTKTAFRRAVRDYRDSFGARVPQSACVAQMLR